MRCYTIVLVVFCYYLTCIQLQFFVWIYCQQQTTSKGLKIWLNLLHIALLLNNLVKSYIYVIFIESGLHILQCKTCTVSIMRYISFLRWRNQLFLILCHDSLKILTVIFKIHFFHTKNNTKFRLRESLKRWKNFSLIHYNALQYNCVSVLYHLNLTFGSSDTTVKFKWYKFVSLYI